MAGDAKRRFCEHCQLHVHNLSAMPSRERAQFVAEKREHACITYELRSDGTMVTPSRWSWVLRPLRAMAAIFAALLPFVLSSCVTRRLAGAICPPVDHKQAGQQLPGKSRHTGEVPSVQAERHVGGAKPLPGHPPIHG